MRKLSVLFLAGTLLLVPLCGCAQSSSPAQTDGQAQADGKYDEIIADLEEEDYDGAIDAITEMKKEAQAKAFGNIEDYLVTIELTKENFDEYFEEIDEIFLSFCLILFHLYFLFCYFYMCEFLTHLRKDLY